MTEKKKTLARFNRKLNFQSRKESAYKKTLRNYRSCKDDGENNSDKCVSFVDIRNESTKYSVCTQAVYWSIMQLYKMGTFKVVIIVQMDLYWFFVEYYITLFVKWCTLHFNRVVQKHQLLRFLSVTFIFMSWWNFQSRIWQWDMLSKKVTKYNIKIAPPPTPKITQTNKQTNQKYKWIKTKKKHKNNITLKPSRLQTGKSYITQFTAIYSAAQWCNDWQEAPPAATSLSPWICLFSLCMGFPWILQFPLTITA